MSEDGLRRMEERASKAENLITNIKAQIDSFKKSSLELSIEEEETRLKNENDQLRQEVEHYKQKLIELERRNGIAPIFISSGNKNEKRKFNEVLSPLVGSVNGIGVEKCVEKKKTKEKQNVKKIEPLNKVPPVDELVDVSRLDFRIGRITSVKKHPDADSLYVEEVDLAESQPRVVVSGLVNHVPMEEMHNRLVVLLCNLKPAKMRGVTSEGMVMCASSPEKVEILIPPANSKPGDRIVFEGYPGNPDEQLNPKKKIFEQIQPDLRTSDDKIATYKGVPFTVPGKGIVVAPTMALSAINLCINLKSPEVGLKQVDSKAKKRMVRFLIKLKQDPERLKVFKQKNAERADANRKKKKSDEEKQRIRDLSKIRCRNYRARQKEKVACGEIVKRKQIKVKNKIIETRAELNEKRRKWREFKRKQRMNRTIETIRLDREKNTLMKSLARYCLKSKTLNNPSFPDAQNSQDKSSTSQSFKTESA